MPPNWYTEPDGYVEASRGSWPGLLEAVEFVQAPARSKGKKSDEKTDDAPDEKNTDPQDVPNVNPPVDPDAAARKKPGSKKKRSQQPEPRDDQQAEPQGEQTANPQTAPKSKRGSKDKTKPQDHPEDVPEGGIQDNDPIDPDNDQNPNQGGDQPDNSWDGPTQKTNKKKKAKTKSTRNPTGDDNGVATRDGDPANSNDAGSVNYNGKGRQGANNGGQDEPGGEEGGNAQQPTNSTLGGEKSGKSKGTKQSTGKRATQDAKGGGGEQVGAQEGEGEVVGEVNAEPVKGVEDKEEVKDGTRGGPEEGANDNKRKTRGEKKSQTTESGGNGKSGRGKEADKGGSSGNDRKSGGGGGGNGGGSGNGGDRKDAHDYPDLDAPIDLDKIFPSRLKYRNTTFDSYEKALKAALHFIYNGPKPANPLRTGLNPGFQLDVYQRQVTPIAALQVTHIPPVLSRAPMHSARNLTFAYIPPPKDQTGSAGPVPAEAEIRNSEDFLRLDYDDDCGPHFNAKFVGDRTTMGDRDECPKEHFLIAEPIPLSGEMTGDYLERLRAQMKEWRDTIRGYRGPDPIDKVLDNLNPGRAYLDNTDPGDPKPNLQDEGDRTAHLNRIWNEGWAQGKEPKGPWE
ncbi:hypothetical protein RhiLY_10806 [Ceratobasidium sp. AG-Ba]|nr:hypothetical protein RhiLY_10806 [Ceratobasidium sp. AG-Ba]